MVCQSPQWRTLSCATDRITVEATSPQKALKTVAVVMVSASGLPTTRQLVRPVLVCTYTMKMKGNVMGV